jgi:hypothetical protein
VLLEAVNLHLLSQLQPQKLEVEIERVEAVEPEATNVGFFG